MVYSTTIVVSTGVSMRTVRVNGTNFVFPRLRERKGEKGNSMTLKLANGLAQNDFFVWSQHPTVNIPKPEFHILLVVDYVLNSLGKLVQWNGGQVNGILWTKSRIGVDNQHM
jgi:hypothetical protein